MGQGPAAAGTVNTMYAFEDHRVVHGGSGSVDCFFVFFDGMLLLLL
jgi:hypothetical protein